MTKKSIISMIIEALVFIVLLVFVWNFYSDRLSTSEHNLSVSRGQIEQLELSNGELLAARDSYILKYNELSEEFGVTKSELREIKRKLGEKVAYIAKLESEVRVDTTIIIKDSLIYRDNDKITSSFKYRDDWLTLSGQHNITGSNSTTTFEYISMYTPLQVGLTEDYKIWVKSANPYVMFNTIEGAVVDGSNIKPKKKRFGWGLHGGFGIMYDVIDKDVAAGPTLSFGVHVNF